MKTNAELRSCVAFAPMTILHCKSLPGVIKKNIVFKKKPAPKSRQRVKNFDGELVGNKKVTVLLRKHPFFPSESFQSWGFPFEIES